MMQHRWYSLTPYLSPHVLYKIHGSHHKVENWPSATTHLTAYCVTSSTKSSTPHPHADLTNVIWSCTHNGANQNKAIAIILSFIYRGEGGTVRTIDWKRWELWRFASPRISIKHLLLNKHRPKDANYSLGGYLQTETQRSAASITFSTLVKLINFYELCAVCSHFQIWGWHVGGEGSFFTFVYTPGMLALSKCPGFQSAKLQHFDSILKGFHSGQK